jgi:hypothetical protein
MDPNVRKRAEDAAKAGEVGASFALSLYDYVDYMFKVADFTSKIDGDITLGKPLSDYKTQTSVFTPKIKKLEDTEFKITPNSAFKVRACC